MSDVTLPDYIAAMSFEDALAELEGIVRRLESGQVKLDDAIQSYERGAQLKRLCEQKLNEAQQRVDRIVIAPDGAVTTFAGQRRSWRTWASSAPISTRVGGWLAKVRSQPEKEGSTRRRVIIGSSKRTRIMSRVNSAIM